MSDPTICPVKRRQCASVQICWLVKCAVAPWSNPPMRPVSEGTLTKAERYAIHMEEQKKAAARV